ncbi:MAG: hypothetical protein PHI12_11740 [Dehalococcoidales bacterium]|nr:hypothetical protein [Dehalococcoidales bacterium]
MMLMELAVAGWIFMFILLVVLMMVGLMYVFDQYKQLAEPGSPLDEFMGGDEALDEIHTFFDGVYARWNGIGAWDPPHYLTEEEAYIWERERRYAALGWMITDVVLRFKAWLHYYVLRQR